VDEVIRDDVWGFRSHIKTTRKATKQQNGQPYSEVTANNKTGDVITFLNAVGRTGLLLERDWQVMKGGPSKRIPYSKAEITKMREVCDVDERDVLEFLVGTGLRKGEAAHTTWVDIDFLNRYVRVGHGEHKNKDKEPRNIQLGPKLLDRLQARRGRYPQSKYVFQSKVGGPDRHLDRYLERILGRAGVSKAGKSLVHSLRKTYATRLRNDKKYDVYKIMKLLGHSDLRTTELYLDGYDPDSETVGADIEEALKTA
jgi:integrase/recombinase XerD